jgi:glutaredoxin
VTLTIQNKPLFFLILFAVLLLFVSVSTVNAAFYLKNGTEITGDNAFGTFINDPNTTPTNEPIYLFYSIHCGACQDTKEYLDSYIRENPDVSIKYLDIFNNTENRTIFEEYKKEYNQKYSSVPVLFIGNAVLEGGNAIKTNFDPIVKWYKKNQNTTPSVPKFPLINFSSDQTSGSISIPLIIGACLFDGINPCAFAVHVLFTTLLLIELF